MDNKAVTSYESQQNREPRRRRTENRNYNREKPVYTQTQHSIDNETNMLTNSIGNNSKRNKQSNKSRVLPWLVLIVIIVGICIGVVSISLSSDSNSKTSNSSASIQQTQTPTITDTTMGDASSVESLSNSEENNVSEVSDTVTYENLGGVSDPVVQAREDVIFKWTNEADEYGTAKYIEDIYKEYPNDAVILNIYFYCSAKKQYNYYISLGDKGLLESAKEFAANIDPTYDGAFAKEMQSFANELLSSESNRLESYTEVKSSTDKYNNLSNNDKKKICDYIQSRYDYYDSIAGSYSGDKYTDIIWQEAEEKYNLTETQIDIIWMNMYSY